MHHLSLNNNMEWFTNFNSFNILLNLIYWNTFYLQNSLNIQKDEFSFQWFHMNFQIFKRWMVLLPHVITLLFNVAFIRAILNKHMWKIKVTYISIFINLRYIHKFKMFLSASMCWFWHSSPSHIDSNSLFRF